MESSFECSICLQENIPLSVRCTTNCNHSYCKSCLDGWFHLGNVNCPMCRQSISYFYYENENYRIIHSNELAPTSTPIPTTRPTPNQVILSKQRYQWLRFLFIGLSTFVMLQMYNIYHLHSQVQYYKEKYHTCSEKIDYWLKNIQDNHLLDLGNKGSVFMMNSSTDELSYCEIPVYYIHKCFSTS